jgi:hypothetical protein
VMQSEPAAGQQHGEDADRAGGRNKLVERGHAGILVRSYWAMFLPRMTLMSMLA